MVYVNDVFVDESKIIKEVSFYYIFRFYFYIFLKGNI